MPPSNVNLEDRIRDLCAKAISAEQDDLEPIFHELKSALREHTEHLRAVAATKLARKLA